MFINRTRFNVITSYIFSTKACKCSTYTLVVGALGCTAFYLTAFCSHQSPYHLGQTIYEWISRKEVLAIVTAVLVLLGALAIVGVCCVKCRKRRERAQRSGYEEIGGGQDDLPYWRPAAPRAYVL